MAPATASLHLPGRPRETAFRTPGAG
jgi:hypothetical protein